MSIRINIATSISIQDGPQVSTTESMAVAAITSQDADVPVGGDATLDNLTPAGWEVKLTVIRADSYSSKLTVSWTANGAAVEQALTAPVSVWGPVPGDSLTVKNGSTKETKVSVLTCGDFAAP